MGHSLVAARLRYAIRQGGEWLGQRQGWKASVPDVPGYDDIRGQYEESLFDAFISFAGSSGAGGRRYRNLAGRAVIEAVNDAFYRGYRDAGGEETEADDETWLTARQSAELSHLPGVFEWLKEARDADPPTITEDAVRARVDKWLSGLDGIYSEGRLRGADNVMLTFDGDDGQESCNQCQKYKGQRHSAKWWVKRDLVRRNGNDNFDCGRWENCQHNLFTDDGELYTR